jgi:lipoprotein NlpI
VSYILNALKRSEQERTGDEIQRPQAPAALAARDMPTPKTRPTWMIVTLGGGGAVALLAAAVFAGGFWQSSITGADGVTAEIAVAQTTPATTGSNSSQIERSSGPSDSPSAASTQGASETSHQASVVVSDNGSDARMPTSSAPVAGSTTAPPSSQPTITAHQRVDEPSAGGRLPTQRSPRLVLDEPEKTAPLMALVLDPPVAAGARQETVELTGQARSVVVSQLPGPAAETSDLVAEYSPNEDQSLTPPPPPPPTTSKVVTVTPRTGEPEPRREIAAATPARADRVSLTDAADLHEKGWAFERAGNFTRAIDAFTSAVELRPDFADAYFGRAWIRDRMDQLDQASADYGHAIRIEPKFAAAYGSRGVALFYLNQLAEAEADFEQSLRFGRGELRRFAILWKYLSAEHDGRDGEIALASDIQNIKLDRWPGVIAQFYLDTASADAVLSQAKDPDPDVRRERLCVAYFFIAQKQLLAGRTAQARDNFQKALDTGVTEFIQHKAAQRELDRLARLR